MRMALDTFETFGFRYNLISLHFVLAAPIFACVQTELGVRIILREGSSMMSGRCHVPLDARKVKKKL